MKFTAGEIELITGGTLHGNSLLIVESIITDSRQSGHSDKAAFIAISGQNHDGHRFIGQMFERGVRVFICETLPTNFSGLTGCAFIITRSTIHALQILAASVRNEFEGDVIAVTGSAGKTIVKEWLADLIGQEVQILRSPKSYNSQIGVPLSVIRLEERYKSAVFEAGISKPGEMDKLRVIINPSTVIITNIGDAHGENFSDNDQKIAEKLKLALGASTIVYSRDHSIVKNGIAADNNLSGKRLFDWSFSDKNARVFIEKMSAETGFTKFNVLYTGQSNEIEVPFDDKASLENVASVITCALSLDYDFDLIRSGVKNLVSVAMRMEMKHGINNSLLIHDYYNSDPGSLGMALEYLTTKDSRQRTLILSDFVQSGRSEEDVYLEVSRQIKVYGIKKFIGVGKALSNYRSVFPSDSLIVTSTEELIQKIIPATFQNEVILIKGARSFGLEKVAELLEEKIHQTILEVNLDAVSHNLNQIRASLSGGTRIMAMVKAFAYGAGSSEIATLLEYHGVGYFGVAYTDEGVELRKAGVTLPVMVMNPDPGSFETILRENLEPVMYSFPQLESFGKCASRHGLLGYPVHIEIDTGMHRLGFMPYETEKLANILLNNDALKVASVFSHFASSEDPSFDKFTSDQVEIFVDKCKMIQDILGYQFLRHICNTSAIFRFPDYHFEMVRPGIGIFGEGDFKGISLKQAGCFRTRISQVKCVAAGEPVGYGCTDVSDKNRVIAIIPVGYADGLNRLLGNGVGEVWIKGGRRKITGRICMDMCMADVTGSGANEGDEVEIFGEKIPISEVATKCMTIPYEILTSIPPRVKRIFIRDQI